MNSLKVLIIILIFLGSFSSICQNKNDEKFANFYIVDTITINNPLVFYKTNQSGKYIKDSESAKEAKCNIKKALKNDDIYIFGEDLYRFFDDAKKIEEYKYPDFGNCDFETESTEDKRGIVYKKFKSKPTKFILGLINASYYDRKITIYGKKKSVLNNYNKSLYYKIVFPLCE